MDFIEFKNPPSAYRSKPFWSWNGKLEKKELLRQIDVMKKMGFGGFFMHSRTGLDTEYLSDEWFSLIRACAEYAYSIGMEAWLYDEDRWPSGTAGGLITKNPDYCMRFISMYESDTDLPLLGRFAVKDENDFFSVKSRGEVPKGYRYMAFYEELMNGSDFYNGSAYLDTMNPDAVKAYFESTHALYKEKCGDMFGKELKGIFTDEPHRGSLFTGFGITNKNAKNMCPYTKNLFPEYEKAYGESLQKKLPLLYLDGKDRTVTRNYVSLIEKLFLTSFTIPYSNRCKENGLIFTGHYLHEDSLASQVTMCGSLMRVYEHMDYPGVDNLTLTNNCYQAIKQCASVAKQTDKPFVMCEMYAASGWDSGLEQFKQAGDWQTFYGVSLRCLHLSMYTMCGEAKRDYPASILHQAGLTDDFSYLENYFARFTYLNKHTRELTDTLVINPVELMFDEVKPGWADVLYTRTENGMKLEYDYSTLLNTLLDRHVSFDYADEDILERHCRIEKTKDGALLYVRNAAYKVVLDVFPKARASTRRILDEFKKAGGRVVTDVEALMPDGGIKTDSRLKISLRQDDNGEYIVVMNTLRDTDIENAFIETAFKDRQALEIDLLSGEYGKTTFPADRIPLNMYRGQVRVFFIPKSPLGISAKSAANRKTKPLQKKVIDGEYSYKLGERNVLPLDSAKVFLDGEASFTGDILAADRKLREKLGLPLRGGEMVQPWFKAKYSKFAGPDRQLRIEYAFSVSDKPKECLLAIEGAFGVTVNGKAARPTDEFWTDICFKVFDISDCIQNGGNVITLSKAFKESDNLEAVYVLGDFGVRLPDIITTLPAKLSPRDFADQMLPYYGGAISLYTGLTGGFCAKLDKTDNTAVVKFVTGGDTVYAPFYPYEAEISAKEPLTVQIVLSKKNIFGPLHQESMTKYYADPNCFTGEGKLNILD